MKTAIRLTESQLHRIIENAVNNIIKEAGWKEQSKELRDQANNPKNKGKSVFDALDTERMEDAKKRDKVRAYGKKLRNGEKPNKPVHKVLNDED